MQIVIDIKKREWEYLNKLVENGDQLGHYERLLVNGIPLPKGHERLFDERDIVNGNYEVIGNRIYELEPIIEADKAESEDKDDKRRIVGAL